MAFGTHVKRVEFMTILYHDKISIYPYVWVEYDDFESLRVDDIINLLNIKSNGNKRSSKKVPG